MASLRSIALRAFAVSGVTALLRPLHRHAAVVFMLHRFSDPRRGIVGHDPDHVRTLLGYLRRRRYQLMGLDDLLQSCHAGEPAPNAVAFTIDDGYADQATVGGPLFAEFDCPVTTFVTTGFLDGSLWFWWDQIEFVVKRAWGNTLALQGPAGRLEYRLDPAGRHAAQDEITRVGKTLADDARKELIDRLATAAAVTLPERPPLEYSPMTWDQLRACERGGMTFGPHSVSHGILARMDDHRAATEIRASWARLKTEATTPIPVFAYPNGVTGDWGEREQRVLQREGLRAVTAEPGFVTTRRYRDANGPVLVPRFALPDSYDDFVQKVGGLERLKSIFREARGTS